MNHAQIARAGLGVYKVEPYVVAADVYAVPPHSGRGGWTWYTGSAGWMYRLIVESLLGLRLEVESCTSALPARGLGRVQGALSLSEKQLITSRLCRRVPEMVIYEC